VVQAEQEADGPAGGAGAPAAAGDAAPAADSAVQEHVVRTAELVVDVDDLGPAAARVRSAVEALVGVVASEATALTSEAAVDVPAMGSGDSTANASSDSQAQVETRYAAPGESVLVVRVPVDSFDAALERVSAVGQERSRTTSSQDVTADVADLDSRVESASASLDRVRSLLGEARDLNDVVLLESELTRRQSDLEALQARRAVLADRAALATVTVVLRTPDAAGSASNPFLDGLRDGWDALIESSTALLQVLGAALPWLAVLGVVLAPLALRWRRRRQARPAAAGGDDAAAAA
jgi:hypothetical protein